MRLLRFLISHFSFLVCSNWPLWLLWFWFYDTQSKSALKNVASRRNLVEEVIADLWKEVKLCLHFKVFWYIFRRPYRYFSIALKVILMLSDRYKTFTCDWPWIEVCENAVLIKIDITMATINKKTLKLIKAEFCAI